MARNNTTRYARAAAVCTLVAVGLCLYARTIGYEFVHWDDTALVVENPWIRSLSLDHLTSIFTKLEVSDRTAAVIRARERGLGG